MGKGFVLEKSTLFKTLTLLFKIIAIFKILYTHYELEHNWFLDFK